MPAPVFSAPFQFGGFSNLLILDTYSEHFFSLHTTYPFWTNELPVVVMSSTGQTTSSLSNFQSIINAALADYTKQTGIDLTKGPFAEKIELSNSPEAILELLQEREKTFKEYRQGNRRLISCISPAVKVLHAFSGILGEAVSLVSITYHSVDGSFHQSFNVTSAGPLLTCKGRVHKH